jgi:hypothetical protein
MPTMPNLVGLELAQVQPSLQLSGVIDLQKLGYFATWPVAVKWQTGPAKGIVSAQIPLSGATVAVNVAIIVTVTGFPVGSVYP